MKINLNPNKDEFSEFLVASTLEFISEFKEPTAIGIELSISKKTISVHYNYDLQINKLDKSPHQFEILNYRQTQFEFGIPNKYGLVYDMRLWTGVRNATRKLNLPTVLCCFENSSENYFAIETELELFGRYIIKFFRDDNLEYYNWYINKFTGKTMEEIENEIPNHWLPELKKKHLEDAIFFNNLSSEQFSYLNIFIKQLIDVIAMNVMRAIDENTGSEDDLIDININKIKATDLPMIGNGNLSGEYLDWCERFSDFGPTAFL